MQSRLGSFLETLVSTLIGFIISGGLNLIVFPSVGCTISTSQNIAIVGVFTLASIIRSFAVRRLFVHVHKKYNF